MYRYPSWLYYRLNKPKIEVDQEVAMYFSGPTYRKYIFIPHDGEHGEHCPYVQRLGVRHLDTLAKVRGGAQGSCAEG
jgi:hypothetical protein